MLNLVEYVHSLVMKELVDICHVNFATLQVYCLDVLHIKIDVNYSNHRLKDELYFLESESSDLFYLKELESSFDNVVVLHKEYFTMLSLSRK